VSSPGPDAGPDGPLGPHDPHNPQQDDPAETAGAFDGFRDQYRQQMLDSLGGWSGSVIAAIPTVVFVAVNAIWSLRPGIAAAVASALVLAAYRTVRRQSRQQALSGLFGVLIAAVIAARTGKAKGYFLFGILTSFGYAAIFLVSIAVRKPLIGLLWEFLDPTPGTSKVRPWFRVPVLLRAYTWATLVAGGVFLARGIVQSILYHRDATGWLAVARIAMGYPLYIAAVGFAFWVIRRARTSLRTDEEQPAT
jgi:hypothetical protein